MFRQDPENDIAVAKFDALAKRIANAMAGQDGKKSNTRTVFHKGGSPMTKSKADARMLGGQPPPKTEQDNTVKQGKELKTLVDDKIHEFLDSIFGA